MRAAITGRTATWTSLALALLLGLPAAAAEEKDEADPTERAAEAVLEGVSSSDFHVRSMAVRGLALVPDAFEEKATKRLDEALADPQWRVRRAGIEALRERGGDWREQVRKAATDQGVKAEELLDYLEGLEVDTAAELLGEALETEEFPAPKRYAAALASRGGELMVAVYRRLERYTKPVTSAMAEKLPELPMPEALEVYREVLRGRPSKIQIVVLERFQGRDDLEDLNFLEPLVDADDAEVALEAAAVLAEHGNDAGRDVLVEAVESDDDARQLRALRALDGIANSRMRELVKSFVNADEPELEKMKAAYGVLVEGGHPKLGEHLETRLDAIKTPYRAAAVWALARHEGRAALETLHDHLDDGPKMVRLHAAEAVGHVGHADSVEPLRKQLFNERSKEVKAALIEALGEIGSAEIVSALQMQVQARNPKVRRATAEALTKVKHAEVAPLLELVLGNARSSLETRSEALAALLRLNLEHQQAFDNALGWLPAERFHQLAEEHGAAFRPHLEAAIRASSQSAREAAIAAAAKLPEDARAKLWSGLLENAERTGTKREAIERLVELRPDGTLKQLVVIASNEEAHAALRADALVALGRMGAEDARDLMVELLGDPRDKVRVGAAQGLLRL